MQVKDLNQEAQQAIIPQAMINLFAQSIYAQLEDLAMDSSHLLTLFAAEDYTEVKTVLQSSIQKMQHMLNNVGVLEIAEQQHN